ncbi:hypothetical protein DUI87_19069 [Hirundo rustica rustica]|uniref:RNase H type-1 domain-containing protein n=1 Tax=Hirundo rustica rustica TaxID=333673 RepID=A0A3M0JZD3_HIRRU|nr:hypothetical protein DUI87_19069 [Hirundo rustica rustica]
MVIECLNRSSAGATPDDLSQENLEQPVVHECLETMEAVYSRHPDLKEEPVPDAMNWFTDGSTFVRQEVGRAGYAVITVSKAIESNPLPAGTSAQKAELIALTRALELAKGKKVNIWTNSKYANGISCPQSHMERKRTPDCTKEDHQICNQNPQAPQGSETPIASGNYTLPRAL